MARAMAGVRFGDESDDPAIGGLMLLAYLRPTDMSRRPTPLFSVDLTPCISASLLVTLTRSNPSRFRSSRCRRRRRPSHRIFCRLRSPHPVIILS